MPNTTGSLDGKVAYVTGQWHRLRHRTGVRPPRRQRRGRRHRPPRQPGHRPHDREPRRPGPRRQRRRDPQRGRTSRPHQDSGEVRAHGLRLQQRRHRAAAQGIQREQARSVWSRPGRRRASVSQSEGRRPEFDLTLQATEGTSAGSSLGSTSALVRPCQRRSHCTVAVDAASDAWVGGMIWSTTAGTSAVRLS